MRWLSLLLLLACDRPEPTCSASGAASGTTWRAVWVGACTDELPAALQERITRTYTRMSVWSDTSEIRRIREGGRVEVSEETCTVVRTALDVAAATGGAFDPTIEPVMEAWGMHLADGTPRRPEPDVLAAAVAAVDYRQVEWGRDERGACWVDGHGAALDLEAVLQGQAADGLSATLERAGIARYLVDVGGELRAGGEGPNGRWRVEAGGQHRTLSGGLAAAGGRTMVIDGEVMGVTMDSTTGQPITPAVRAVVWAPSALLADVLATAVATLGAERGLALLDARDDVQGTVEIEGRVQSSSHAR